MVKIHEYSLEDKKCVISLLEELQDYLLKIDSKKLLRRSPEYGKKYFARLLKIIKAKKGKIYLAKEEKTCLGFIAGIIEKEKNENSFERKAQKEGRILELIVSAKYRGQNIGTMLMQKMEKFFIQKQCPLIRVEVFKPNQNAYDFYQKLGYEERSIDLLKILKI